MSSLNLLFSSNCRNWSPVGFDEAAEGFSDTAGRNSCSTLFLLLGFGGSGFHVPQVSSSVPGYSAAVPAASSTSSSPSALAPSSR